MRYKNQKKYLLDEEEYQSFLESREITKLEYYPISYNNIHYPTDAELKEIDLITHIWQTGDKLTNLAWEYYNQQPELWWIIAYFNKTPTEQHIDIGDIILIPTPLNKIMEIYQKR